MEKILLPSETTISHSTKGVIPRIVCKKHPKEDIRYMAGVLIVHYMADALSARYMAGVLSVNN